MRGVMGAAAAAVGMEGGLAAREARRVAWAAVRAAVAEGWAAATAQSLRADAGLP